MSARNRAARAAVTASICYLAGIGVIVGYILVAQIYNLINRGVTSPVSWGNLPKDFLNVLVTPLAYPVFGLFISPLGALSLLGLFSCVIVGGTAKSGSIWSKSRQNEKTLNWLLTFSIIGNLAAVVFWLTRASEFWSLYIYPIAYCQTIALIFWIYAKYSLGKRERTRINPKTNA